MGKRAPCIRQSDVGAGLTRVSLSSFLSLLRSLNGCAIIPQNTPPLSHSARRRSEKESKSFVATSTILFLFWISSTHCVSLFFFPCGSLEGGIVSPFEFQSTPLINVPGHTTQGIQMRVIHGEKEKGTRTRDILKTVSFFLAVCLGWSLGCLPRAAHSFPSWRFDDEGLLLHPFPRVVVANVSHYSQSKELCVFDQVWHFINARRSPIIYFAGKGVKNPRCIAPPQQRRWTIGLVVERIRSN